MKKGKGLIIFAVLIIIIGIVIVGVGLSSNGFDIKAFSTVSEPITKTAEYNTEEITKIYVETETGDLNIIESVDEKIHVKYTENENYTYVLTNESNTLSIKKDFSKNNWFRFLQINFYGYLDIVEISIPSSYSKDLEFIVTTGEIDIDVENTFNNVYVKATTGKIEIESIKCNSVTLKCTTGGVDVKQMDVTTDMNVNTSTGRITLNTVNVIGKLIISNTTGNISLDTVIASDVSVINTTGGIKFINVDSSNIYFHTTTGNIRGSFSDAIGNYNIISDTTTGENNLPSNITLGSKNLKVTATTGDIKITFGE